MVSLEEAQHYDSFDESAVYVRNALKSYGFGKRQSNILQSLNMTVKKGTIYGLLGASGCGKTTLLSCIVGRRSLNSGEIYVFGGEPGTKESSIPGPRVGYMPQELALYGEFTIKETLEYFGRLYRLPKEFVNSQMDFLCKLLDLPPGHRYVKSLSGGQQRRVSFAVALFHDPELLILDEPTVGVDPLIRERIWNHLVKLSTINGRTIIITTHYIEEARQSHTIGMMRNGRLLAESLLIGLLASQNLNSLEDVFLKLCVSDNNGFNNYVNDKKSEENTSSNINNNNINQPKRRKCTSNDFVLPSFHRTFAVAQKNLIQTFRNIGLLTFILVFPAVAVSMFCLAIGHDPTSLDIGIVNDELTQGSVCHYDDTCNYSMLSCRFLRFLTNETIIQIQYSNYTEAFEAFQYTKIYGIIHFGKNFSDDLKLREINGADTAIETILGSEINVQLDWTNHQISRMLQRKILDAFEDFGKDFVKSCSHEELTASIPVTFMDYPIYGSKNSSFTNSMAPAMILTIVYIIAVALTAVSFVAERRQGLLDRVLVGGVQTTEIMLAYLINQLVVLIGQVTLIFLFVLFAFKIPITGSISLAIFMALMQGFSGMCLGLAISILCDQESSAIQMALGIFNINILLSGVIWPKEGMHVLLRKAIYYLPQSYAIDSMNSIFARGWGIERPEIYFGFLVTFAWIFAVLTFCFVALRVRKYVS